MSRFSGVVLSFVLISQLILTSRCIYAQDTNLQREIGDSTIVTDTVEDIGLLTKQYRLDFVYDAGVRMVVSRTSLSKLDMSPEKPTIIDPYKELKFESHPELNELWIVHRVYDKKTKQYKDISAHVFDGISITSNIVTDQNMIAFATDEGIRLTLYEMIINTGFVEPVFIPLIALKDLEHEETKYQIKKLEFINTESQKPIDVFSNNTDQILYTGDLLVTQLSSDGSKSFHTVISRSKLVTVLRNQLLGLLYLVSFYVDQKEQEDIVSGIESVLSSEIPLIKQYFDDVKRALEGSTSQDIIIHTLKNIGAGDSLKTLLSLFRSPEGKRGAWQVMSDFSIRLYARLCYPIVKHIWDAIGQKNIYPELQRGLTPVFTKTGASEDEISEHLKEVTNAYLNHQDKTLLSKVLAASIVVAITSKADRGSLSVVDQFTEEYSDMVNVVQLLMKDPATQLSYVTDTIQNSSELYGIVNQIATYIYQQLINHEDSPVIREEISPEQLYSDIQYYLNLRSKIFQDPKIINQKNGLKKLGGSIGAFFSKRFVPLVLYGQPGVKIHKKFSNVSFDNSTVEVVGKNFKQGYLVSTECTKQFSQK